MQPLRLPFKAREVIILWDYGPSIYKVQLFYHHHHWATLGIKLSARLLWEI